MSGNISYLGSLLLDTATMIYQCELEDMLSSNPVTIHSSLNLVAQISANADICATINWLVEFLVVLHGLLFSLCWIIAIGEPVLYGALIFLWSRVVDIHFTFNSEVWLVGPPDMFGHVVLSYLNAQSLWCLSSRPFPLSCSTILCFVKIWAEIWLINSYCCAQSCYPSAKLAPDCVMVMLPAILMVLILSLRLNRKSRLNVYQWCLFDLPVLYN